MTNLEVRTFWEWDADGVKCGERSYVPKDTYDALAAELDEAMELLRKVRRHGYFTEQHNVDAFLADITKKTRSQNEH